MDLPTCPSCKQSVLDDDATECPFCGSSMTGKPGAKPAAPAATQKKAAPEKRAKAKSDDDDDNPFGDAPAVTGKVISLLAKPAKGRTHRVLCPMCETAGFHSKQVAGREVRCANKDCLVPVFTAPQPEGEEPAEAPRAEAEEKSGTPILILATIVVAAGLAIYGGVWWATSGQEVTEQEPFDLPDNGSSTPKDPDNGHTAEIPNGGTVEPAGPTFEELWAESLQQMVNDSRDQQNQRKELSRQLTAEAYAIRGDLEELNTQLKQLAIVAPRQKYLGVNPLVTFAWIRLAAGDAAAAGAEANRALETAKELPDFGADALDAATELATLLVALDRNDEAETLLKPRENSKASGQLLEALVRARATGTGNVDLAVKMRPVIRWVAPLRVAVTVGLSCRGYSAKALAWAKAAADPQAVRQCVSAWGEARIQSGKAAALAETEQQLAGFSPVNRAMVLSRLAIALHATGQNEPAKATLAKAQAALQSAGSPASKPFPNLRQIYELKPQDVSGFREAAIAAAEIAHAQSFVAPDDAWDSVSVALGFAREMAHSPVATQQALAETQRSEAGVTARLKVEFNFQTDNEANDAFKQYRDGCRNLVRASVERFKMERSILRAACEWELFEPVWLEIRGRATHAESTEKEPWFDTELPSIVKTAFNVSEDAEREEDVQKMVTAEQLRDHPFPRMWFQLMAGSLAATDPKKAAIGLDKFRARSEADSSWTVEMKLRLATRLAASGEIDKAFVFVESISRDPVPRHAGFEFIAGQITSSGDRKAVPARIKSARLKPEDRVALRRGFVAALKPDPPPAVTESETDGQ